MLIPFPELIKKYKINPQGVFHVGSNTGEPECKWYYDNGVKRTVWIEALPDVYKEMKEIVSKYPKSIAINACISDVNGKEVNFNVSSNHGESSSMFEFGSHAVAHPDVTFTKQIKLKTSRIDSLVINKGINIREFDFLNIDLQSAEMLALKGMGDMLRLFSWLYIEVNRGDVYIGSPQFEDICAYVKEFGFELKEVKWTGANWGDAFFEKKHNMNSVFRRQAGKPAMREGIVQNVPQEFMQPIRFPYPPDNELIFETWYYHNYNHSSERLYLPIQWTGTLVNHNFGNDTSIIERLQKYVDGLDRSKKYYTIHQFDLGCMVDFKDLEVLVFGMAGGRIDYCLPLLSQPHKFEFNNHRTLFATFVGRKTHPIRELVFTNLQHRQGCYISEAKHDLSAYCSLLASSVFGICCRGFGNNSFRLQECLQYGAIPVVVSDVRLEPHGIPFENYGYYIDEKDADRIYEILQNKTVDEITEKQSKLKYYYDNFFTYDSNKRIILEQLKK